MSEKTTDDWVDSELADELSETVATITRLGVTLAGLPLALLPQRQRARAKQFTSELLRFGAVIPRAMGAMLDEVADEWEGDDREDLGSRLRREQRKGLKQERRAARGAVGPGPDEVKATVEVKEDMQDAWNEPPVEPGESS